MQINSPSAAQPPAQDRQAITRKVTLVGAVINLFLTAAQIFGGILSGSQALIADAIHTLSDLVSDGVVLIAAQQAHKDADEQHPYGHARIETVATVILGLILASVAVGIFLQAWERLTADQPLQAPQPLALWFAALAIIAKEGLYHYTVHTARRIKSKLLEANAWHHRSDAISSIIVFVGIIGSQFGLPWLDTVAAIIVALMILFMAGRMILDSTMELVDTGIEPEQAEAMLQFIRQLDGVKDVHMLRTRKMGGNVLADAHIQVNSFISVSEGHYIAEYVMHRLKKAFPDMTDVTVHIDPEDDEAAPESDQLPTRKAWTTTLQTDPRGAALWPFIDAIQAHYLEGYLRLDIALLNCTSDGIENKLLQDFKQCCLEQPYIKSVHFYQKMP